MIQLGKAKVRKGTIKARVYRAATGQWEDLGVICSTSLVWRIKNKIKILWQQLFS